MKGVFHYIAPPFTSGPIFEGCCCRPNANFEHVRNDLDTLPKRNVLLRAFFKHGFAGLCFGSCQRGYAKLLTNLCVVCHSIASTRRY